MRRSALVLFLLSIWTISEQQSLLESMLSFVEEGGHQYSAEPPSIANPREEYDFIVIGAGTAGCVVANRLTENPNWTVLLLEAGGPENYIMDLPVLANYLQFTEANWRYNSMPSQNHCLAMDNHQCNLPRGRVMGGSSVLNYMIYTRGNRRDFDNWAAMGNPGWSYQDILPYYKKVENYKIKEERDAYHGKDGYLSVDYAPYRTKLSEAIVKGAQEYGLKYVDYDGATQPGVSYLHVSMKDGVRHSSSSAYLHPIKNRPNLHVKKYARATKILINPQSKQTKGVEFVVGSKTFRVRAIKEVIVSAGAIDSPKLLMLSGIGPKKHLSQVGIPLIKNLKVGYNLMDHIAAGGLTFTLDRPYSVRTEDFLKREPLIEFMSHHKGPLTLPGGCEVLTFSELDKVFDPDGYPDMELLYQAGSITSDPVLKRNFGIRDEIYDAMLKPLEERYTFMVLPMLLRPKSKGRIVLQDANYRSKPYIFPNYYAYPEDVAIMVGGIRQAINISMQPSMRAIGAQVNTIPIPDCAKYGFGTDKYWECHARHFTFTIYHQSGTCKMGPAKDKRAVVDPRLRVYGIKGLRVVDASIIPEIPAAHTNAPVYMIAEKACDMIKEDWRYRT